MLGRTLGHYAVLERIGAGGMGVVYRARDTQLERHVALKVVSEKDQVDVQAQARLMREARTASVLNHPNICTVYEAGATEGATYIAMELLEGRSLNSIVAAGPLPVETVVRYGVQIADALAHAHERGVIHRDLKCANAVITTSGQLKVLDFGLARRETRDTANELETVTQTGLMMGTLPYMAPESLQGHPADARTDLWAMGVMLYRALAGSLPFEGATAFQIGSAIERDEPPPLPRNVPPALASVVKRLLAKQPADRYANAGEAGDALRALQPATAAAGMPVRTSPRRWLWVVASLAVAALALFAGLRLTGSFRTNSTPVLSDGSRPSANSQANEYYERALLFGPTGVRADPDQLKRLLERALEADPHFAPARGFYSWSLILMLWGGISNDAGLLYKAEEEARRALRDDPACAQAYADLAVVHLLQGRKELFPNEVKRAFELNPRDSKINTWRVLYHQLNGDYDRAIQQAKDVIARAPLNWPVHMYLGDVFREQGDTSGAVREESGILDQEARNGGAMGILAQAYLDAGDLARAREVLERAGAEFRKGYRLRPVWALLLALEKKTGEALREMDTDLQTFSGAHAFAPLKAAEFYAVMGDPAKALEWLDRGIRMGDDREGWLRRDPHLASIRHDPRFEQMLASVAFRRTERSRSASE